METIGAYEAKTHLPKLLERVSKGERITITKHGVPVAVLLPPDCQQKADPAKVIDELRNFRKQNRLNGLNLREMIEEGRR
ncbi:MAG: type II toxin-antitoxin system prevent-host-death family antitoxin [Desulfosalsimonadaceae bacterium]